MHICLTELSPAFGTTSTSIYSDRDDLIDAVLASVHVPFWMDPRFSTRFRGRQYIDGSVYLPRLSEPELLSRPPYMLPDGSPPGVRVYQFDDARMQAAYPGLGDFLASYGPQQKSEMMEWGASHFAKLDEQGGLSALDELRKPTPTSIRIKRPAEL